MDQHKKCASCSTHFICNPSDIQNCSCNTIVLEPNVSQFLAARNWDCVCTPCLHKYNHLEQQAQKVRVLGQPEKLIEGTHYEVKKGLWVFTELHHYLRGDCCGNRCTNCVYGYENVQ